MQTFTKITKLKFKNKRGRIEVYRFVQMDINEKISYAIYLEKGGNLLLQYKTEDINQLNDQFHDLMRKAKEEGKKYCVCRII